MPEPKVALLIRIPPDLKARLVDLAGREHRSLNQQIECLLERSFDDPTEESADSLRPEKPRKLRNPKG
jgi:hypothetical protein